MGDTTTDIWDTKALYLREWKQQRTTLEAVGWRWNEHQGAIETLREDAVVYLKRVWRADADDHVVLAEEPPQTPVVDEDGIPAPISVFPEPNSVAIGQDCLNAVIRASNLNVVDAVRFIDELEKAGWRLVKPTWNGPETSEGRGHGR